MSRKAELQIKIEERIKELKIMRNDKEDELHLIVIELETLNKLIDNNKEE